MNLRVDGYHASIMCSCCQLPMIGDMIKYASLSKSCGKFQLETRASVKVDTHTLHPKHSYSIPCTRFTPNDFSLSKFNVQCTMSDKDALYGGLTKCASASAIEVLQRNAGFHLEWFSPNLMRDQKLFVPDVEYGMWIWIRNVLLEWS